MTPQIYLQSTMWDGIITSSGATDGRLFHPLGNHSQHIPGPASLNTTKAGSLQPLELLGVNMFLRMLSELLFESRIRRTGSMPGLHGLAATTLHKMQALPVTLSQKAGNGTRTPQTSDWP